jgi:hypothetical protein
MILLMSSKSEISLAWTRALRSMTWMASIVSASLTRCICSSWAQPRIALIGVRSSCDSVATNSSLIRFARSASARASRSLTRSPARSSSMIRRSVMSTIVPTKPAKAPSAV